MEKINNNSTSFLKTVQNNDYSSNIKNTFENDKLFKITNVYLNLNLKLNKIINKLS